MGTGRWTTTPNRSAVLAPITPSIGCSLDRVEYMLMTRLLAVAVRCELSALILTITPASTCTSCPTLWTARAAVLSVLSCEVPSARTRYSSTGDWLRISRMITCTTSSPWNGADRILIASADGLPRTAYVPQNALLGPGRIQDSVNARLWMHIL